LISLLLMACQAPDNAGLTETVTVSAVDATEADSKLIDRIHSAKSTLRIALPGDQDTAISDAILEAVQHGIDVEVIADVDSQADPGILALLDAAVPVHLADGAITWYDFNTNLPVGWTSDQVLMSHAFVVADRVFYTCATAAGTLDDGTRIVFEGHDEDLGEDLSTEHNQIMGGTDSTARDAYNAMAKNIADLRWDYGTQEDARIEVWFGPQERLTKRITDAVFSARHTVRLLTDDLANEGLVDALEEKAAAGFEVTVVVGPRFGVVSTSGTRAFRNAADVNKSQLTTPGRVPTILLVDEAGYDDATTRALVVSHDMVGSSQYDRGTAVANDQLIDGNLWAIDDWGGTSPLLDPLIAAVDDHASRAGGL
jgi:hypothetical protein